MSLIIGWKDANIFSDALGKIKKKITNYFSFTFNLLYLGTILIKIPSNVFMYHR